MSVQSLQKFADITHLWSAPALLLLAVCLLSSAGTFAQAEPELNIEFIEQRLNTLRDSGAGEDDATVTAFEEARDFLRAADSFNGDAESYADAVRTATGGNAGPH